MKLLICTQKVDQNDAILGFFHRWIEEFARQCDEVVVICLQEGAHSLPSNVRVYSLGKERGGSRLLRWWRALRYIVVLRNKYDAVFVHMNPEYAVLGGWLWRLWRKKIVLWYTHKNVDLKLRIATFFANKVATASKESFRLATLKVVVVGHGIDTSFFSPAQKTPHGGVRLLSVGRISQSKRHDLAIRTMSLVEGAELAVVGGTITRADMACEKDLRVLVEELGMSTRVHFVGPKTQTQLRDYYRASDILLHTSETGSVDKVVLEALACGLPVVSTSEAFAEGSLPVLHVSATADAVAAGIRALVQNPPSAAALADPVRAHHGIMHCICSIMELYHA